MTDFLESLWNGLLDLTSLFVIPDWGALIALLPVFLVLFLIGPVLSLGILVWLIYVLRAPRTKVSFEDGPRAAGLGADGRPVFPVGEPYCPVDGLVYPFGATRCDLEGHELSVTCPKCSVGRRAAISTCGNCGLVLRVEPRARALRPSGPPPGGAAVA